MRNTGVRETSSRYVLLLNSDAWMDEGSVDALAAFADAHPEAAVVGPRLRYSGRPVALCTRFPHAVAAQSLYLRKLAPRSTALNAFYAGGFDHASVRDVEVLMGAVWLIQRTATADDAFFFSEEPDWAPPPRRRLEAPVARRRDARVRGLAQGADVRREPARAAALPAQASRREVCRACAAAALALRLRGVVVRRERGAMYREGARCSPGFRSPICSHDGDPGTRPPRARAAPAGARLGLWLRLAAATLVLLLPGRYQRHQATELVCDVGRSLAPRRRWRSRSVHSGLWLTLLLVFVLGAVASVRPSAAARVRGACAGNR